MLILSDSPFQGSSAWLWILKRLPWTPTSTSLMPHHGNLHFSFSFTSWLKVACKVFCWLGEGVTHLSKLHWTDNAASETTTGAFQPVCWLAVTQTFASVSISFAVYCQTHVRKTPLPWHWLQISARTHAHTLSTNIHAERGCLIFDTLGFCF